VEVAAELTPHGNIIRYFQAWQEGGHFYLQMEYCECNLSEHVERLMQMSPSPIGPTRTLSDSMNGKGTGGKGLAGGNGKITNEWLADTCKQIAQGLHHIHTANVLHLDIKPDNILVANNGVLKLADFGHASLKKDWKDGGEGDSMYMAPELLGGGVPLSPRSPRVSVTPKADIFSLGLLLFELATGTYLPSSGPLWHKLRTGMAEELLTEAANGAVVRALHLGLKRLIVSILNPVVSARPSAEQILSYLRTLTFDSISPPTLVTPNTATTSTSSTSPPVPRKFFPVVSLSSTSSSLSSTSCLVSSTPSTSARALVPSDVMDIQDPPTKVDS